MTQPPPHNIEAEETVLGGILSYPEKIHSTLQILQPSDFFKSSHRIIYRTMQVLASENDLDTMKLVQRLEENQKLDDIGGAYYITGLPEKCVSSTNIESSAEVVAKTAQQRKTINYLQNTLQNIRKDPKPDQVIADLQEKLLELNNKQEQPYTPISEAADKVQEYISELYDTGELPGLKTGFVDFDNLTGGYQTGLHILAARPSMGKTALAIKQMLNIAKQGHPVGFVSLETSDLISTLRMTINLAKVDSQIFNTANINQEQYQSAMEATQKLKKYDIYIDATSETNASVINSRLKVMHQLHDIQIAFVDFVQLMNKKNSRNRNLEIGAISRSLQETSKELGIPIIALSQVSRKADDRMPVLGELRDSGELEQNADSVIFLFRPEQVSIEYTEDGQSTENLARLKIAKFKNGPTGQIKLTYIKKHMLFQNHAPQHMQEKEAGF